MTFFFDLLRVNKINREMSTSPSADPNDPRESIICDVAERLRAFVPNQQSDHDIEQQQATTLMADVREALVERRCDAAPLRSQECREAMWALGQQLRSPESCGAYGEVVRQLCGDSVETKRSFLTVGSRDALCVASLRATTPKAAGHVSSALAALVADNDEQRRHFGTEAVRSAIVALIITSRDTPASLKFCLTALKFITVNNDNEALFGTSDVYEALLRAAPCCSTSGDDMAELFGNTLRNLTVNEDNKIVFNTSLMAAAAASVGSACRSSGSVRMMCGALSTLSTKSKVPLGTIAVRDSLIHMAQFADSQIAIRYWANAMSNITIDDDNEKLFATPQMRDAVVMLANKSVDAVTIQWIASALRNICAFVGHKPLVGTFEVRDAIVGMLQRCIGPESVRLVCSAMLNVAENAANKIILGTVVVRETLVAAGTAYATTPEAARVLCGAIASIIINDDNELLFGTPSMRNLFIKLAPICSSAVDSLQRWCLAVRNFTVNIDNKTLLGTVGVRNACMDIMRGAKSLTDLIAVCKPIAQLTANVPENRKMFGTIHFREAIMELSTHLTSKSTSSSTNEQIAEGIRCLCNAVANITIDDDNELLYAESERLRLIFTELIIPAVPPGEWSAAVTSVGQVMRNLCSAPVNKELFSTELGRTAFCTLASKVSDASSCQFVSAWLEKLAGRRESRKLFCTTEVRAAILQLGRCALSSAAVSAYCNALAQLACDDDFEEMYVTSSEFRDTLAQLGSLATSPDAALRLSHVVLNLTAGVRNRAVFCTPAFAQALETIGPYIASAEGVRMFAGALYHLLTVSSTRDLFITTSLISTMMRLAPLATTADSARAWGNAVLSAAGGDKGKVMYGTPQSLDAIVLFSQRATTKNEVQLLARIVSAIARNDDSEKVFATDVLRDTITSRWMAHATTCEAVTSISIALRNLACAKPHKLLFGTPSVCNALAAMLQVASSNVECLDNVCNVIRSLCEMQANIAVLCGLRSHLLELKASIARGEGTETQKMATLSREL
ncbi:Hypothetical protein, putative [Bodo saltans]|uniref:Uncharacterized protein n=1 Tax=Bodo saltans TaxID=75058 RepID=A0A0S4J753_BODSA|nr:Hypothetical protein, putative [Bodo saltans]|eukprot:CUG87064.1 Hypothetical protein, putative [Bodo saltans]